MEFEGLTDHFNFESLGDEHIEQEHGVFNAQSYFGVDDPTLKTMIQQVPDQTQEQDAEEMELNDFEQTPAIEMGIGHNLLYQNLDRCIDERDTTKKLEYLLA